MIDIGAGVEATASYEIRPLHEAAAFGHTAILQSLISAGAWIDGEESLQGMSPLEHAVFGGHEAAVGLLLQNGADTSDRDFQTRRACEGGVLSLAARLGNEAIVTKLIRKVRSVDEKSRVLGRTALMEAARKGHECIVRLLFWHGADIRAKNTFSTTVLHYAAGAEKSDPAIVRFLLDVGAKPDVSAKDGDGCTPMDAAARRYNKRIEQVLTDAGGKMASTFAGVKGALEFSLFQ